MRAIVTGSGGLIGSECVRFLSAHGWDVVGIDNIRRQFFGDAGSTMAVVEDLQQRYSGGHAAADCAALSKLKIKEMGSSVSLYYTVFMAGEGSFAGRLPAKGSGGCTRQY